MQITTVKHHAVVFEGDSGPALEAALLYVEKTLGISIEQNPDFVQLVGEKCTIEQARKLKELSAQAPLGHARVFILSFDQILVEAQNALLKLLEEPYMYTHYVLVLPSTTSLLPTVHSRLHFAGRYEESYSPSKRAQDFLRANAAERMRLVRTIIDTKDRAEARRFIRELERELHARGIHENIEPLKDVALAENYIQDTSSSVKHILTHLISVL